jgi:hypothetical protein
MNVQTIDIRAVKSVLKREPVSTSSGPQRLLYVTSRRPEQGTSHLYGTLPWHEAHATRSFRERHQQRTA